MSQDFPLLEPYEVAMIREGRQPRRAEYGKLERVEATGRSRCRACGRRIIRGRSAVRCQVDFKGSGSWTVVQSYVHATAAECEEVS